jgi:AcrR family transcriptional regulator
VTGDQRQRLLGGAAVALAEHGYAAMSVDQVLKQAGVSRTAFYENFDDKRECVLAAHDAVFGRLVDELFRACRGRSDWSAKVASAVPAAIDFVVRAPDEAHLLFLDVLAAEPTLAERVTVSNDFLAELLSGGREHCPGAASLPDLTEQILIGATLSIVSARVTSGQADRLPALAPQLAQLILMPYLGVEEARRVTEAAS